ncbi:MAG: hypothetical protein A2144_12675 [Chloroflexi bacterium RBG_16_50_9]|nr:MAG: hypothetical protein A2144_12675 [Chloroflexi bacterium RBG_16_50_9]
MVSFYDYLKLLLPKITNELVICTLAGVSRQWFDLKRPDGNLYTVYMAGATPIALGLALALPHRRVISLDSDGSLLMGLTILPVVAQQDPSNLIIIVCDNESYGAIDGLPTHTAGAACLAGIARESGIRNVVEVKELTEFQKAIDDAFKANGSSFIVAKVKQSHQPSPHKLPHALDNKFQLVRYMETTENRSK